MCIQFTGVGKCMLNTYFCCDGFSSPNLLWRPVFVPDSYRYVRYALRAINDFPDPVFCIDAE